MPQVSFAQRCPSPYAKPGAATLTQPRQCYLSGEVQGALSFSHSASLTRMFICSPWQPGPGGEQDAAVSHVAEAGRSRSLLCAT